MSRKTRNARLRQIVVVSAVAATVAGGLNAAPSSAAPAAPSMAAGTYVVVLKDSPSASYAGGVSGFAPTQATPGKRFDHQRDAVARYEERLAQRQDAVLARVGATARQRYTTVVNGFSAMLTGAQATRLSTSKDVLFVQPDEARKVDTVASPQFLGLTTADGTGGVWDSAAVGGVANAGKGVVVGVIDSGIWPENPSFAGAKLTSKKSTVVGEPYKAGATQGGAITVAMRKADGGTFVGACENGEKFAATTCNTKVISARYFATGFLANVAAADRSPYEYISPRDGDGHGSHTASTAAGNNGVAVTIDGKSFGKASGMAPAAKIAVYKVCWEDNAAGGGCYTSDSVAAINQAVQDGVDVLNYSISGALNTVVDSVEYAFFGAAAAGVFVAASAGNSGPTESTVAHNSPWLTTVAAGTHRALEGTVRLGNDATYKGASLVSTQVNGPVVLSTTIGLAGATATAVRLCAPGSLDPAATTGKIVVCDRGGFARTDKSAAVKAAGGIAMILANTSVSSLDSDLHFVPTVHVDNVAGEAIKTYVSTTAAPTATLLPGDTTGGQRTPVPQVAGFSSRGPALASNSDLLKPDITAPGVSVIAAVAPGPNSGRNWDFLSGTSMSSPHIAGLAALYFGVNPTWSPMAVKSAMMTTAYDTKNADGTTNTDPFAQGAGFVDPTTFFTPGLVITSGVRDWEAFYAGQGLDLKVPALASASDLNVPSIAIGQLAGSQRVRRTLTAVSAGTYSVSVDVPGFAVDAPASLTFAANESKPLDVTFTRTTAALTNWAKGFITLRGSSTVRLPVALRPVAVAAPREVSGSGPSGQVAVTVTAGFTGDLAVGTAGLAAGTLNRGSLASGGTFEQDVTIEAGTKLARFDLDAANNQGDFDLYVYRYDATGAVLVAVAGQSATGSADERVDLFTPRPGKYRVVAENFANAPGETIGAYSYKQFLVTGSTTAGNLIVTPNPVPVSQGEDATFTASWSGLTARTPYLGLLSYDGALAPTVLSIS